MSLSKIQAAGCQIASPVLVLAAAAILFCGCSKKNPPAATTPPPAETAGQPTPADQPAVPKLVPPGTTLTQPDGAVDLPELQRTVIRWVVSNRRRPNSFEDFAATAGTPIPPPPTGKKYILTKDLHVQLVNR